MVACLEIATDSSSSRHGEQSCPSSSAVARHLRYSGPAGVCSFRQDSRSHATSLWLPTKKYQNNPMQSSRRSVASGVGWPEQNRVEAGWRKIARSLIPGLTDMVEAVERVNRVWRSTVEPNRMGSLALRLRATISQSP